MTKVTPKQACLALALLAVFATALSVSLPSAAADKPEKKNNDYKPVLKPKFDAPAASDYRNVDPQNVLIIGTTKGRILVELIPEVAPQAVARISQLAHEHFYDGLTFHRVVPGFMTQGGDPKGDGSGGSDKPNVPGEFFFRRGADTPWVPFKGAAGAVEDGFVKSMPARSQNADLMVMTADGKVQGWGIWCAGVAGMARAGDPNSANSQFFLMHDVNGALERQYTPFGRVIVGEDVVKAMNAGEPVPNPDKMTSVRLLSDLPPSQQFKVQVVDASSPWAKKEASFGGNVCDVDLPGKVTGP